MPKLFISYRREDSAYPAHSICERLKSHFGKESVFIDVDTIPFGVDFRKHLNEAVGKCDVLLAVIGSKWLDSKQEDGTRRLDDPRDFVRIEIEAALHRDIPVIPVLVDQVGMPRITQLPEALSELAFRNATTVRPGLDFDGDLDRLVRGLQKLMKLEPGQAPAPTPETATPPEQASTPAAMPITIPPASQVESARTPPHEIVEAGDIITNSIGMKLKLIPAGEFLMGSPNSVDDARGNEKPQHRVKITKPFYLGVYPVTQDEYERISGTNPSHFNDDGRRPVENVSWLNAIQFCNHLSEQEGRQSFYKIDGKKVSIIGGMGYRLPTEAEWEYACRAGTKTKWNFGDDESLLNQYAWHQVNSGSQTHPVGELKSNPWGLYDTHGNIWEWCWDFWGSFKRSSSTNPSGPSWAIFRSRVLRGGACDSRPVYVRSATRYCLTAVPGASFPNIGFRLARTSE